MATHSSVLAWRIPGTGEPGGLPSMQSHRVGHDWSDLAVAAADFWIFWYRNLVSMHLRFCQGNPALGFVLCLPWVAWYTYTQLQRTLPGDFPETTSVCLMPAVGETLSCFRSSPTPDIVCMSFHLSNSSELVDSEHLSLNLHLVSKWQSAFFYIYVNHLSVLLIFLPEGLSFLLVCRCSLHRLDMIFSRVDTLQISSFSINSVAWWTEVLNLC